MDISQPVRNLIIERHLTGGQSWRQIANSFGLPKSSVSNILRRYKKQGITGTIRKGKCGRKRSLTLRDERNLARLSTANPQATARQVRASVGSPVTDVSISTIKRSLQRSGRAAYRPSKSPTLSAAQRLTRLQWCRAHVEWKTVDWKKVSFCK
jgi:transposase